MKLDISGSNAPIGDTNLGKDSSVNERIARMLADDNVEKDDSPEPSLSGIETVIGAAKEETIPRSKLYAAPDDWQGIFSKATEDNITKMAVSIHKYGLLHRITVWERDDGYMILGGHTRVQCFDYLYKITGDEKYLSLPAKVYAKDQLDETNAHRILVISNTDQRRLSMRMVSYAYAELIKLEKKNAFYGSGINTRNSAAKQAGVAPATLSKYLRLQELIDPLFDEVGLEFSMMAAYYISWLPKELQQYLYDEGLYTDLTVPQAKKISNAKSREEIKSLLDKSTQIYRYSVTSKQQKTPDMDIIPVFVKKNSYALYQEYLVQAISESSLPDTVKKDMLFSLQ